MFSSNTTPPPTDYSLHDIIYNRNKDAGLQGWDDAEELAEQISYLGQVFAHQDIPKAGRVLDIGCGAGNISFWLESLGYDVMGIDVSKEAIKWAKEKAALTESRVMFSVFDAARERFEADEKFDIVLDNHCLHCIIGDDRKLYLNNIFNNLKPDGIYICNTMCDEIGDSDVLKHFDTSSRCYFRNNMAVRYIGLHEDIINEIETVGFRTMHVDLFPNGVQDTMCYIAQKIRT